MYKGANTRVIDLHGEIMILIIIYVEILMSDRGALGFSFIYFPKS